MTSLSALWRWGGLVFLPWLVLAGCLPASRSGLEEEKDPHYLTGKSRLNSLDHPGAIEAFEKALENNPRSAAAHLELGLLFEQQRKDYAAAIYHFERHLMYRPGSNVADSVRERITSCKMQLASTVPYGMINRQVQAEMTRLNQENAALRAQVDELTARLALAAAAPPPMDGAAGASVGSSLPASPPSVSWAPASPRAAETFSERREAGRAAVRYRSHTIQRSDTVYSLSRRYNVSEAAILSANPGLEPTRLRIGQTINIPLP